MAKHCNMHSVIFICSLKRYSKAYKTYYRGLYNHCKRLYTTFLKASFGENDERKKVKSTNFMQIGYMFNAFF